MLGTFFAPPQVSDPDIHQGTCETHVPWCMLGSLTNGFLWSWWLGKRSRQSRRMRNPQFYMHDNSRMTNTFAISWYHELTYTRRYLIRLVSLKRLPYQVYIWILRHHQPVCCIPYAFFQWLTTAYNSKEKCNVSVHSLFDDYNNDTMKIRRTTDNILRDENIIFKIFIFVGDRKMHWYRYILPLYI